MKFLDLSGLTSVLSKLLTKISTAFDELDERVSSAITTAGSGLSKSGTTLNHANSITAGKVSGTVTSTVGFGETIKIPSITYNATGHIIEVSTTTITLPTNPNTDTHYVTKLVISNTSTGSSNATATNGNVYLNLFDNTTLRQAHKITGTGNVSVTSDSSGNITVNGSTAISITGNAATATKLQNIRTINGTNFDGSSNITTFNWGTSRNITIGNTSKSVNGSSNVSWTLSEIGAASSSHTHSTGNTTTLGLTKLYTSTGTATDGTMTQNALKTALDTKKDKTCYRGDGGSHGKSGFIAFAKIKVLATYVDTPIEFKLVHRGASTPCLLSVIFRNHGTTDPDIFKMQYIANENKYNIFAHKTEESTWILYCQKSSKYDNLTVLESNIYTENHFEITYPHTYIETKPSSNVIDAVLGYSVGRAESSEASNRLNVPRYINNVAFDGTKDINIGLEGHSCYVGNVSEPMYHRILSTNKLATNHKDYTITLYIQQPYNGGYLGIVNISLRTNGAGQESNAEIKWLVRCGFELDQICFNLNNTNGKTYIDVFYKSRGPGQTMNWYVLAENSRLDTYNNKLYIKHNTTTEENQNVYTLEEMKELREYTNKLVKGYDGTIVYRSGRSDKLTTARTINGTAFDGSSNITTSNWGTSRTLTIGNTGKSVNGSGNVSWSLSEIGVKNRAHIIVASYDTKNPLKANADYICTSANANSVLKTALNDVAPGGRIELLDGSYYFSYTSGTYTANSVTIDKKGVTIEGCGWETRVYQPVDKVAGEADYIFNIIADNVKLKNMMIIDYDVSSPVSMIKQSNEGAIYDNIFFIFNGEEKSCQNGCIEGTDSCSYTRIQNCRVYKSFSNSISDKAMFNFSNCSKFNQSIIGANLSTGYDDISVKFPSTIYKNSTAVYGHTNIDLRV